jgi:hypothetical protein
MPVVQKEVSAAMTYPVSLKVDYPERLSRLTTFFRLFTIIPAAIVLGFVSIAGYIMYVLSWFAIVFTGKYPDTFFDFVTWWFRWGVRVLSYVYLLTDKYPPFTGRSDVAYPVRVEVDRPGPLSRLTSFLRFPIFIYPTLGFPAGNWRWTWSVGSGFPMTFPHMVVLFFLSIAMGVLLFLSWFAIVFTGKYPRSFFDFVVWVFRWSTRVEGYSYLFTDIYPPFTGNE